MIKKLYEMANLRPVETGLSVTIYVSKKENSKHAPRIKVSKIYGNRISSSLIPVTIEENPRRIIGSDLGDIKQKDIKRVINFIKINRQLLLDYWFEKIDNNTFFSCLKKI